jgi:hypothetical protein
MLPRLIIACYKTPEFEGYYWGICGEDIAHEGWKGGGDGYWSVIFYCERNFRQRSCEERSHTLRGINWVSSILELLGIGNPNILRKYGIEVLVPNEIVGENLQDHVYVPIGAGHLRLWISEIWKLIFPRYQVISGIDTLDNFTNPALLRSGI